MAKFCSHCGSTLNEEDKVCGKCGTPVAGAAQPAAGAAQPVMSGSPVKENKKTDGNNIIKLAVAAIVLIVVVVIAANIIGNYTGYKGTLRKMAKALQSYDMDTLDSLASSVSDEVYDKSLWFSDDLEEAYDDMVSAVLDKYEDSVGNIKKITYEIKDVSELSDRRMEELQDELIDTYNMDVDQIKKVMKVDLKITVKGSKKSSTYNVNDLFLIKESGGWKIYYGSLNY